MRVLLAGASGFVGSHLFPRLVAAGLEIRSASRDPERAAKRDRSRAFCKLDLANPSTYPEAFRDVDRAVYLVHSMSEAKDYAQLEERSAANFRDAAARFGLTRIVYLGGMRPRGEPSHHLASRLRTGEILRSGSVPVIELQATMIVGGGSESFRIVRDLASRLPFMLLPGWLRSVTEPVAVRDVSAAIVHALTMAATSSRIFAVPGPEQLSGREILSRTARLLGRKPRVLSVPFVTPRFSSYWIRLVTRANAHVASELVEGLRSDIVATGDQIWREMPSYERTPFDVAVREALAEEAAGLPSSTLLVEGALRSLAPAWSGSEHQDAPI